MTERIFRVDLYPHEWLTLTGHMTPEQRGVFIQVCCLIYANRGPIKNDPSHIGRASNCSSRLARTIIDQLVKSKDLVVRGEFVSQKRCESELNLKRTLIEHGSKGGRKSAENRRESNKNNEVVPSQPDKPLGSSILPHPTPVVSDTKSVSDTTPPPPQTGGAVHDVYLRKYVMPDGIIYTLDGFFDWVWANYPSLRDKGHKRKAREYLIKKLKEGADYEIIRAGVERIRAYCEATGENNPDCFRWLRDDGFERPYVIPADSRAARGGVGGETHREQRQRALSRAAERLGLIEPGDSEAADVP